MHVNDFASENQAMSEVNEIKITKPTIANNCINWNEVKNKQQSEKTKHKNQGLL